MCPHTLQASSYKWTHLTILKSWDAESQFADKKTEAPKGYKHDPNPQLPGIWTPNVLGSRACAAMSGEETEE